MGPEWRDGVPQGSLLVEEIVDLEEGLRRSDNGGKTIVILAVSSSEY